MKNKYVIIGLGAVLTASIVLYLVKKKEKSAKLSQRVKPDNKSVRVEIPANYQETAETPLMKEVQEEKPAEKTEEPITVEAEEKETRSVIKAAPGSRRIGQYDDDMNLIAEFTPEMNDTVNLPDFSALGLLDVQIIPHYHRFIHRFDSFEQRIKKYELDNNCSVLRMDDGDGLFVEV